ncbi:MULTISPECIES: hypothetical protein [Actinomycetes]|uniref:hypothetical protein n=1 Tax=Actinomycetes TaxID=1760 RepID=UPI000A3D4D76|nr:MULTISPECIES: hypothetical protein [Streptomyces]
MAGTPVTVTPLLGSVTATATCPAGTVLLSGGYSLSSDLIQVTVSRADDGNPNQWDVTATGLTGLLSGTVTAYAYCTTTP